MEEGVEVVLALGSNLGDRLTHLRHGVEALAALLRLRAVSPVCESDAVGFESQPAFLNAVALGTTILGAEDLLGISHRIEAKEGRLRSFPGSPRTLDVDLVFYGDRILEGETLRVPHPRWKERSFGLAPRVEIAPRLRDPESGQTVLEIWEARRAGLPSVKWTAPSEALWRSAS